MHECPDCGRACDCDGEDTWFDDLQTFLHCSHDCDEYDDDDFGVYIPDDEREQDLSLAITRDAQLRNEADTGGHSELDREPELLTAKARHEWTDNDEL